MICGKKATPSSFEEPRSGRSSCYSGLKYIGIGYNSDMERGGSPGGRESLADAFDEISRFTLRNVADRGEIGITAMSALGRLDQDGPVRLTALAAAEGISQPSMTQ